MLNFFLYRHEGEFLEFINPKVTIIPEINKYKTFDVPIVSLIKSKLYLFGISRIISKIFLKLHCLLSKEKRGSMDAYAIYFSFFTVDFT